MRISGEARPGFTSGDALNEMERLAGRLPRGFGFEWTGQSLQEKLSGSQAPFLLALSAEGPRIGPALSGALTTQAIPATLGLLYIVIFATVIGYGIWNTLLAKYPTSSVVPFTLLVPVVGILAAWIAVGEQPTLTEIVGGAIMLAGLAVAVIVRRAKRQPEVVAEEAPSG